MDGFGKEDLETINKLRAKYSNVRGGGGGEAEGGDGFDASVHEQAFEAARGLSTSRAAEAASGGAKLAIKAPGCESTICSTCQGSGQVVSEYNHRRMERMCDTCDGKGIRVFKDGVEVREEREEVTYPRPGSLQQRLAEDDAEEEGGGAGASSGRDREVAAKLEAQLQQIEAKLQQSCEEHEAMQASAGKASADPEEKALREDVAQQLALHIERLKSLRVKKQAVLARYRPAAGASAVPVTIESIIQHRAPL